jgi:DNA-binding LacI/PurR family transcriptional regulator
MSLTARTTAMTGASWSTRTEQVASVLKERIATGNWSHQLPGIRFIATSLRVSVSTAAAALELLCEQGVITSAGPRRRFLINHNKTEFTAQAERIQHEPPRPKTLLILTPRGNFDRKFVELHLRLLEGLSAPGWIVRLDRADYGADGRRRRHWDQLLDKAPVDVLVMCDAPLWVANWAVQTGKTVCFIGGNPGNHPAATFGISGAELFRHTLRQLIKLGHSRITMPLCGAASSFANRLGTIMAEEFRAAGLPLQKRLSLPTTPFNNASDYFACLERVWPKLQPTALICLNWVECMGTYTFVMQRGLRIPHDVTVVTLTSDTSMVDWLVPPPAHFSMPVDVLATAILNWVLKPPSPDMKPPSIELIPRFNPGASLMPPPC